MQSDTAALTTTAMVTASGMTFAVVSGQVYSFEFNLSFQAATASTGLKVGLTFPAATLIAASAEIPQAAAGTDANFVGFITASAGTVTATATPTAATTYQAMVYGTLLCSGSAGNLALTVGAEASTASGVIIKAGTHGFLFAIA